MNSDRSEELTKELRVYRPMPASLPADGEVKLEWPSDKIELYKTMDDFLQKKAPLTSPLSVKLSEFPSGQLPHIAYVLNPVKETSKKGGELINISYKCPDNTICEDKISITVLSATEWLVTHDPDFEKNYTQEKPGFIKHAALMNNKARVLANLRDGMIFKLYKGSTFIVDAYKSDKTENGLDVYYFRTDADGVSGAETDSDGRIYIEGKVLESGPGEYGIRVASDDSGSVGNQIPLRIGPLMTELNFAPKIHEQGKLDPYSHLVDVKWDSHWPWREDEEGYGLKIIYDLEDDAKNLKFDFENDSGGGDMGGTHALQLDPEYMKKVAWWNPTNYKVKWEGFDSSITDEEAHRIYMYPDEAEKGGDGISPLKTVKEGKYIHKIELKRKEDEEQIQKYEIKFEVKYETE